MINLRVFGDFDFRPIFGGFLEGLGTSKLVIFSCFSHFYHANFEAFFCTAKNAIFGQKHFNFGPVWRYVRTR